MRAPLAFGAKLVFGMVACCALFFLGHSVNGKPEPEIHTVQNAVLALLGTWALFAVAGQASLSKGLWRAGALLALLAPAGIAVTQATEAGTLHGVGWAAAALCFAVFGHGAGAMARGWPQGNADEDPLKRIRLVVLCVASAAVAIRFLVAELPDAKAVAWVCGLAATIGAAMATAAPVLSSRARARLTLEGIGVAALLLGLYAVLSERGNPLMVWGPLLFLPSYAEARWRPVRAIGTPPAAG